MSQDNVRIVQAVFEAGVRGDQTALLSREIRKSGSMSGGGKRSQGRD